MRRASITFVLVACLVVPGSASARHLSPPPGNSAVDEYVENNPGAGGNQPSGPSSGGGDDGGGLSPGALSSLAALGDDGAAAAAVANATAPGHRGQKDRGGARAASQGGDAGPSGSADEDGLPRLGDAARGVAGSSDGMGAALPIILGSAVVGAALLVIARRRRRTGEA